MSTAFYENKDGEHTGVYGNSLSKMEFDSIFSKKRWKDEYGIKRTYGEFPPDMEFLQDTFYGFNQNPEFFKNDLRVAVIDIETAIKRGAGEESFDATACVYPINLISLYDSGDDVTHVFMYLNTKWYNKPESERPWSDSRKVKYHIYTHYHEMLNSFLVWWKKNTPHVVTGWNIKFFDIPYIINECRKVLGNPADVERGIDMVANHLSPMNELVERSERRGYDGSHQQHYQIPGVNILDYKDLYVQYDTKNEVVNYKLETVAQHELGVGKYENPTNNFYRFYTEYWEEFVEYNIIDTGRVWELEQKLKFIDLAKTVAYTSLIPMEKVFVTTPVVIGALNQEVKLNERVMITSTGLEDVAQEYEGAFVKDPMRGIYSEGVFSIDLNSLYPNIMITLNLSNETYVGKIIEEDEHGVTINLNGKPRKMNWTQFNQKLKPRVNRAANNALFLKHTEKEGVMPKFLKKTYSNRRDTKNKMIDCNNKIAKLKEALKATDDFEV
jgi:DNA polymerase elongation subunit (family B)